MNSQPCLWHIQFHDAIPLLSLFKNGFTWEMVSANFSCTLIFSLRLIKDHMLNLKLTQKFRQKTNVTHVFSALSPSRWPKISKRTCCNMIERCPKVATSAATQTSGLLGWNNTCWFTVDRPQSLFDSYLKNFTAKLDWLVHSGAKPLVCIQCNYSFTQGHNLKIHLPIHSGEKTFSCTHCNYSCTWASNLKIHQLAHPGDILCDCTSCNFSFTTTGHLKMHMLIHSGEKPLRCEECNYSCAQNQNLKMHKLTHSGERPFICTQCNFSCTIAGHLKEHIIRHSGEKLLGVSSVTILAITSVVWSITCRDFGSFLDSDFTKTEDVWCRFYSDIWTKNWSFKPLMEKSNEGNDENCIERGELDTLCITQEEKHNN